MVKKHVLILGAGFGGLELATRLSESYEDAVRVTLIDRNDSFFFGFSKLEVMLGRQAPDDVRLYYDDISKDGVEFRQETVTGIDPATRRVTTESGSYEPDFLVVALGADYDMDATPGLVEGGFEYYTLRGAERMRQAIDAFDGGKVLLSVLGQPFKCPPAPFEGAFLLHERFTQRGIRESVQMTVTFPMQRPVPVTGPVSQMFRDGLADRGIEERPQQVVTSIDPSKNEALLASGEILPYDLFIAIPVHRAPDPLSASRPGGRRLGARRPAEPQDALSRRLRNRRRLHRASDGSEGGHLRRVGRAGRRRRHRRHDLRHGATSALRGVGGLLRRVRRRARLQGRGELPEWRRADCRAAWGDARTRRREGRVRRDSARALVRTLITRLVHERGMKRFAGWAE